MKVLEWEWVKSVWEWLWNSAGGGGGGGRMSQWMSQWMREGAFEGAWEECVFRSCMNKIQRLPLKITRHGYFTYVQCIASPWSSVQNFPYHPLDTFKPMVRNSAQQLTLLVVVRNKPLCQAPPSWRHNAIPWWCNIQNNTSFRKLELHTLSNVKIRGKYLLNIIFLTSRDKNKTV